MSELDIPRSGWQRPCSYVGGGTVPVRHQAGIFRKVLAFSGPGLMISVGYMDPGNWATDLAGGAKYGYALLSVVLLSNVLAILLQHLALKLGVVTNRDLAEACRDHYSQPVVYVLWLLCELAITACDLAEVIGSAIALNLLFHLPLVWGVILTSADVLIVLLLQSRNVRYLEAVVGVLVLTIAVCFGYQLIVSKPDYLAAAKGLIPTPELLKNRDMLYIAIGILGATVMPHNLYLHSSIVKTRQYPRDDAGRSMAIRFATADSTMWLMLAFFINAAILMLSAAAFHWSGHTDVEDIKDAYHLLTPVLGASLASTIFAVALLASGQSSTLTGTLAGQIVMEGFLKLKMNPWMRRLITRMLAVVPAAFIAGFYGEMGITKLLILSQVVLSLQLSFAVVPLVQFTSSRAKMGRFVNPMWLTVTSWAVAALIAVANGYMLVQVFMPSKAA